MSVNAGPNKTTTAGKTAMCPCHKPSNVTVTQNTNGHRKMLI